MSEKAPQSPEHVPQPITPEHGSSAEKRAEKASHEPEHNTTDKLESLSKAREAVQHEALSGKDVAIENRSENRSSSVQPIINHELKQHMFERTLVQVRKRLPLPKRQFSKLVHSKPVEMISAAGEKTVARPAGLLGGSLLALIGSSLVLYFARQSGYRYNYLLFIVLFVAGYLVTTVLEILGSLFKRQKHQR